jgi:hypothetical protein
MSSNNALIYPVNKLSNYIKKESITKNSTNISNLILPNNNTNISNYRLIEKFDKYNPKVYLSKKGVSLKNLNLKQKIPLMKDNPLKNYSKDKKFLKSNSANKNIFESFFNKINYKKKKNNSFCLHSNKEIMHTDSINNNNETFSKINIDIKNHLKNTKSFSTSRNLSNANSEELIQANKNNNNNQILSRQSKKLKSNKSYLIKNKSTYIPKYKTKINLNLYVNQKKLINYKSKRLDSKTHINKNKTFGIMQTNLSDKENINLTSNNDTANITESIIFYNLKQNSKKKINLPFSPNSKKENFYRQIKYKKCYIRNSKNDPNIPYNKKNKLLRQNSYYNLNLVNLKNRQNKKINNTTREDGSSFAEMDNLYKKNSSFDLINKTNTNSYSYVANELCITANENNIQYKGNDSNYGVEMSHFNIVKIIQKNKSLLVKNE